MKKIFKKLFSEDFMRKCTHVFLYLYFIISCLLPLFTDFCVFIGKKSVRMENYGLARICMSTALGINNFMLRRWNDYGCLEYELSRIKTENKMTLLYQAAERGCSDAAWQLAQFHFDKNEKLQGFYYLAKTDSPESDLEWATFYVLFGNNTEKIKGWETIEKLKANCKTIDVKTKAANALRYKKIFEDIHYGKKKWKDFIKENKNGELFGYSISDKNTLCSIGIFFLKNHMRFNEYNPYAHHWEKFANAASRYIDPIIHRVNCAKNFQAVTYANLYINSSYRVKNFNSNILLNKNMPWREWGIEWLKMANEAGVQDANNLLKLFTDAENEHKSFAKTQLSLDDVAKYIGNTLK